MKIDIEVSINKAEDILIFKIKDTIREFVYNYIYSLASVSNINTLCIFLHNGNDIYIKKNPDNYLIINNEKIEIKTENSLINQQGEINIKDLHRDLIKILYENDYTNFKIYFMPSNAIMNNYKIKKFNITEQMLLNQISQLKRTLHKKVIFNSHDLITQRKNLKKTRDMKQSHDPFYIKETL